MGESSSAAYVSPPPPLLQHHQQAETTPVRQSSGPLSRPHVQIQQYGRHGTGEEHSVMQPSEPPVHEAPLSPARPAQPPRRIVPQVPEEQEDEEEEVGTDDEVVPSHLFVGSPVRARDSVSGGGGRRFEADDGDGDTPALPVLQRSMEVPPGRSIPPSSPSLATPPHLHLRHRRLPTSPPDVYEPDSDHDEQALPVRPRHTVVPATSASTSVLPRPTPRRSVPSVPTNEESIYGMPSVAVSEPEPGEILDEEEGGKCLFIHTKSLY